MGLRWVGGWGEEGTAGVARWCPPCDLKPCTLDLALARAGRWADGAPPQLTVAPPLAHHHPPRPTHPTLIPKAPPPTSTPPPHPTAPPPTHTHAPPDLVSYNVKNNEANGEGGRDGTNDNFSWNCGVEGPTTEIPIKVRSQFKQ